MVFRITTWNVNGIRNPFSYQPWRDKKSFSAMFDTLEADIVVLQETKIQRKDLRDDMVLVPGWDCYFSLPKHEKGKFGVVIYTRQAVCAPIRAEEGLTGTLRPPGSSKAFYELSPEEQIGGYPTFEQAEAAPDANELATDFATLDAEGRCVILEFPAFVLLGVYNPAVRDDARNAFRVSFFNLLDLRIRNLVGLGKRVILAGDLNVSTSPLDMANAENEIRKQGLTFEEFFSAPSRRLFNHLVEGGTTFGDPPIGRETPVLHDVCRSFHPGRKGMYTHWETKINARPGNYGSRIDFILCSRGMASWFSASNIQEGLLGSDHCPVYALIKDRIVMDGQETSILDFMNPPGMFQEGQRQREYSPDDLLPLSGKLIPDFSGRRNILDMFSTNRKSSAPLATDTQPSPKSSAKSTNGGPKNLIDTAKGPENGRNGPGDVEASPKAKTPIAGARAKRHMPEKAPTRALKRSKSGNSSSADQKGMKGQQSLQGFFMASTSTLTSPKRTLHEASTTVAWSDGNGATGMHLTEKTHRSPSENSLDRSASRTNESCVSNNHETDAEEPSSPLKDAVEMTDTRVHDPIESKDSWNRLFSKPAAPLCESHEEPCKSMLTKKPGVNCGRSFWMCARPLGPSGTKERATQWRCPTFIWCSDWKPDNA